MQHRQHSAKQKDLKSLAFELEGEDVKVKTTSIYTTTNEHNNDDVLPRLSQVGYGRFELEIARRSAVNAQSDLRRYQSLELESARSMRVIAWVMRLVLVNTGAKVKASFATLYDAMLA